MSGAEGNAKTAEAIEREIAELAKQHGELQERKQANRARSSLLRGMADLAGKTDSLGKALNSYSLPAPPDPHPITDNSGQVLFCGYLEGDFSERTAGIGGALALSGGFFLRTRFGNILFDPGMGTISGLTEMGVDLRGETDAIVVSHYHPSARFDLHLVLNLLGGYCPGRHDEDDTESGDTPRPVHLISSEALIRSRNEHPPVLIPSDLRVMANYITGEGEEERGAIIARPGFECWLWKEGVGRGTEKVCRLSCCRPAGNVQALHIKTFPAYHEEAIPPGESGHACVDEGGLAGKCLCCYLLSSPDGWSLFFTGDTEYPFMDHPSHTEKWPVEALPNPTLLVANLKTITYRRKAGETGPLSGVTLGGADNTMAYTKNQLGFAGSLELAQKLSPNCVVLRALGLECAVKTTVDGKLEYAPGNIALIRDSFQELLGNEARRRRTRVVLPGRHALRVTSDRVVDDSSVQATTPAFPSCGLRRYGKPGREFVTMSASLADAIDGTIDDLQDERSRAEGRPFATIQGEIGSGKTHLARAIGWELLRRANEPDDGAEVNLLDLGAIVPEVFMNLLVGWPAGFYHPNDPGHVGYLGRDGCLVLNQLEKLPPDQAPKFLDILQEWAFTPHRGVRERVKPVLIFTTNRRIEDMRDDELPRDLKNRLRDIRLSIPALESMGQTDRGAEISGLVLHWCQRSNCSLDTYAYNSLMAADLRDGQRRTLINLLRNSRRQAKRNVGARGDQHVLITGRAVRSAARALSMYAVEGDTTGLPTGGSAALREREVWILILLLLAKGNRNGVFPLLRSTGRGRAETTMSNGGFNSQLAKVSSYFSPACFDSGGRSLFESEFRSRCMDTSGEGSVAHADLYDYIGRVVGKPRAYATRRKLIEETGKDSVLLHPAATADTDLLDWLRKRKDELIALTEDRAGLAEAIESVRSTMAVARGKKVRKSTPGKN